MLFIYYLNSFAFICLTIAVFIKSKESILPPEPYDKYPRCQKICVVNISSHSVEQYNSLPLGETLAVFLHFNGFNVSGYPFDLVWVESISAPLLSLSLDFNVYSLTTFSRKVHHVRAMVENAPTTCSTLPCFAESLAAAYLHQVTKRKGAMCYLHKFSNQFGTASYECCKENTRTHQIECGFIPTHGNSQVASFLHLKSIVALIVTLAMFMYFPVPFGNLAIEDKSNDQETMAGIEVNSRVSRGNPFHHIAKLIKQKIRSYSFEHKWIVITGKLFNHLVLAAFFCIEWGVMWHSRTYDLPKMFSNVDPSIFSLDPQKWKDRVVALPCYAIIMLINIPIWKTANGISVESLIQMEKRTLDQKIPWQLIKKYFLFLRGLFRNVKHGSTSLFGKFSSLFLFILLTMALPFSIILAFLGYAIYMSPAMFAVKLHVLYLCHPSVWLSEKISQFGHMPILFNFVVCLLPAILLSYICTSSLCIMYMHSVLFVQNVLIYLVMGIVASHDYYMPIITLISLIIYYLWNCVNSSKATYRKLFKQTIEKCKEYQKEHPNGKKALTFDEEGDPRISSELFQIIVEKIAPLGYVYKKLFCKLALSVCFLLLMYYAILIMESSTLNNTTKNIAFFLSGLIPKFIEMFGKKYGEDFEIRNECRVERIVKDYCCNSSENYEFPSSFSMDSYESLQRRTRSDSSDSSASSEYFEAQNSSRRNLIINDL